MSAPKLVAKNGPWQNLPDLEKLVCGARGKRAADFHDAVMIAMRRAGFQVQREYRVEIGFIDIAASIVSGEYAALVALELDNRSPRKKSIKKLGLLPGTWITGVVLRNPKEKIDALVR